MKRNQKIVDENVTKQGKFLVKLMNDEDVETIPSASRYFIMIRKAWYRYYNFFCDRKEEFVVLHLGSGMDEMARGFKEWKIIRMDKEDYDGVVKFDINNDYEKLAEIVSENRVRMVIMEGLTYYIDIEALRFILELIKSKNLLFILDGMNEEGIEIHKKMNIKMKTSLPLELLPSESRIITSLDMRHVYGNIKKKEANTSNNKKKTSYYVCNF